MKHLTKLLIVLIILAASYSSAWFYAAHKINQGIEQFYYSDAPAMGIEFLGDKPFLSGFPIAPVITYEGGFKNEAATITFDKLKVIGFPILNMPLSIDIDDTVILQDNTTKQSFYLDYLLLTFNIPEALPNSSRKSDIQLWQKTVKPISVKSFETARQDMTLRANGQISLDEQLQPTVNMPTQVTGHEEFIQFFVETGELKPIAAALALSALNAMAQENPETGERVVSFTTHLQNRTLYLGPIRLIETPYIYWPE